MSSSATTFSLSFQSAFQKAASAVPFKEVDLFRAMMDAFGSLKPKFYLEEFHGFKRQVYFDTSHPWMRPRARCELCDVLFVTYSTAAGFEVRMTLLQAKLSRQTHITNSAGYKGKVEPQVFAGNFEQWDLLRGRPNLVPTTVFVPPPALLASAVLPSVGTFGVFHRGISGNVDLFYATADTLNAAVIPKGPNGRYGKLATVAGAPAARSIWGGGEVTYCPSAVEFAASLYKLQIGTPILRVAPGSPRVEHRPQLDWVQGVLASHLATNGNNSRILRELLSDLGDAPPLPEDAYIPSVIVLRGERQEIDVLR